MRAEQDDHPGGEHPRRGETGRQAGGARHRSAGLVELYPAWQQWLRDHQPPTLIIWGRNDPFFPEPGAHAYLRDLPGADLRIFDTGHFALEENLHEIAPLVAAFLDKTNPDGPAERILP
jgi:pimeloyl-ACP methyl ester carboxylesterase